MRGTRKTPPNVERMTSGSYRARVKVNGKTVRGGARRTGKEAYEDARRLQERTVRRGGPDTIGQAFVAILEDCKRRKRRPATFRYYEEQRKVIEAHFGAGQRIATIRTADVQALVDEMLANGNLPRTIQVRLRGLRRAFIIAGRKGCPMSRMVTPLTT